MASIVNEIINTLRGNIKFYTMFQVIMDAVELTDSQLKRFKQVFTRSVPRIVTACDNRACLPQYQLKGTVS
jgi:hypothetical protein